MPSTQRGNFIVPTFAGDPAVPVNGQVWYNSNLRVLRGYENNMISDLTQMVALDDIAEIVRNLLFEFAKEDWASELIQEALEN